MKVTNEMKNIIAGRINRLEREEIRKCEKETKDTLEKFNEELKESEEVKTFLDAARALKEKIEAVISDYPQMNLECSSTIQRLEGWVRSGYFIDCHFSYMYSLIRDRYDLMKDEIILKLSYGSDFDEAKKILKGYGIEL